MLILNAHKIPTSVIYTYLYCLIMMSLFISCFKLFLVLELFQNILKYVDASLFIVLLGQKWW